MNERRPVTDFLDLPTPCEVAWNDMGEGNGVRHCARCHEDVHDLSALSAADVERLLEAAQWGVCVSFLVDREGNMVTREARDPEKHRLPLAAVPSRRSSSRAQRAFHTMAAVAATSAGLGLATGCSTPSSRETDPVTGAHPEAAAAPVASAAPSVAPIPSAAVVPPAASNADPVASAAPSASAVACQHDPTHRRLGGAPKRIAPPPGKRSPNPGF
jgi:hypothetical protein